MRARLISSIVYGLAYPAGLFAIGAAKGIAVPPSALAVMAVAGFVLGAVIPWPAASP